ncbi:MAG: hypothetical protein R3335_15570, partial [Anaerolineales bacterium]|nr:hypothetical protein [Anaerolineales bacterium]
MDEPTVLDYVKAILTPWRGPAPKIPPLEGSHQTDESDDRAPVEFSAPRDDSERDDPAISSLAGSWALAGEGLRPEAAAAGGAGLASGAGEIDLDVGVSAWPW